MDPISPIQARPVRCTKPDCQQRFVSIKEMKRHKKYDPDHFYCRVCDIDCENHDSLVQHKIDVMAPYIEGKVRASDVTPKHVVCEFCGQDFETFGGRKIHRERFHPADQDLTCPGPRCGKHFLRASHLIRHFEDDECPDLNPWQFGRLILHKHVISQIVEEPEAFRKAIQTREEEVTASLLRTDDNDGGVPLPGCQKYLHNAPGARSDSACTSRSTEVPSDEVSRDWPHLSADEEHQLMKSMKGISIQSRTSDVREISFAMAQQEVGERDAGICVPGWLQPCTLSQPTPLVPWQDRKNTAALLFPRAKPSPAPDSVDRQTTITNTDDSKRNMLVVRWWDQSSRDFDVDLFYNKIIRQYECPFHKCGMNYSFTSDFAAHLFDWHARVNFSCLCGKHFDTPAALLAHTETPGSKCRMQLSPAYKKHIYIRTGGLLEAERIRQPEILSSVDRQVSSKRNDGARRGVMHVKFEPTPIPR